MHALLWWLGASLCWSVIFCGGFWLGHLLTRRKYAPPDPLAWHKDVDRTLKAFNDAAGRVSPADWQAAQEHANTMRHRLRDRRDRIN